MKVTDHFLTKEEFFLEKQEEGILKTTPLPQDLAPYYESEKYISHHQDGFSLKEIVYKIFQKFNFKHKKNILKKYLPKNASVLDYGCGAGEFLSFLKEDYQTYGMEPNKQAREKASKKIGENKIKSSLQEIENDSLDMIMLWHVFEHIENREEILHLLEQKIKKNGYLLLALPNHKSYDANYYGKYWAAYDVPRHVYHYTKKGVAHIFQEPKWKIEKIHALMLDAFYISMMSAKYKKNSCFPISGSFQGLISNIKALKTGDYSSLVYIIQKK